MKITATLKVPMKDRLKILWLGGLYIHVDYTGQHGVTRIIAEAIHSRDVAPGNVIRGEG